jgi:RNA polymerase-binding transcription factor DksA
MSELELRHYRQRLLALRDRVTSELPRLAETVLTDARAPGEHDVAVSESADKELLLEQTEEDIRSLVVQALARIDDGTYGRCQMCGGPVGKARLDLIPYTPYCIACERAVEAE